MSRSFVAMVIGLGVVLSACAPAAQPAVPTAAATAAPTVGAAKKIGVAYSNIIADSLSLWVARESRIFAKNGLDVDLQYIASSNAFAALLAGQVQASSGGQKQAKPTTIKVLKQYLKSEDDSAMAATYDYFVAKAPPLEPKPEQFMDSVGVLSEQNPKIKDVDLAKMLDASYFQNALDRKIGR